MRKEWTVWRGDEDGGVRCPVSAPFPTLAAARAWARARRGLVRLFVRRTRARRPG